MVCMTDNKLIIGIVYVLLFVCGVFNDDISYAEKQQYSDRICKIKYKKQRAARKTMKQFV